MSQALMCARVKSGATIEDTQALWLLSPTSFPSVLRVLDMYGASDLGRFLFSDLIIGYVTFRP
jgi:hypothetical protein